MTTSGIGSPILSIQLLLHDIAVFGRYSKEKARRLWRLLILDGRGSHLTMEFINYSDGNNIRLMTYPPHSTHSLQLLDVGPDRKKKWKLCQLTGHTFFSLVLGGFWRGLLTTLETQRQQKDRREKCSVENPSCFATPVPS